MPPPWVQHLCEGFTTGWISATPADYGRLLLVIIAVGWLLTRSHSVK